MSTTKNTKPKSISLILACMSIGCVILAMIVTNFTDITDATISKNKQIIANKKPLIYPLAKDIQHFQITSTTSNRYAVDVEISFSEKKDIQIKQFTASNYKYFDNIDFDKFAWQVQDDTLILNIDNAFSADDSYYDEILQIRLPKQLNQLSIEDNITRGNYKIINENKPMDLTVNLYKANFMGDFKQLTVQQTTACKQSYLDTDYCFTFDDVNVDTLSIITPQRMIINHNEKYKDKKEEQSPLFNALFNKGLSAKQINLNVPKNSEIKITNLALLDKIKWEGVEE